MALVAETSTDHTGNTIGALFPLVRHSKTAFKDPVVLKATGARMRREGK